MTKSVGSALLLEVSCKGVKCRVECSGDVRWGGTGGEVKW